ESFMSGYGGMNVADRSGSFCGCWFFNFGNGSGLDDDGNIRSGQSGLDVKLVGGQVSLQQLRSVVVNLATWDGAVASSQIRFRMVGADGSVSFIAPVALESRNQQEFADGSIYRSMAFRFDLQDGYLSAGAVTQWRLEFTSPGGMALDAIAIDLDFNAVPSPGAMALCVLGLTAARMRRR
ncbi:MAG: hypothetical protein ACKPEA_18980, partial [Planctomycetota bacterium]